MLWYKLTEADTIYFVELIDTNLENEWQERYYFQVQFWKHDDSAILATARYVLDMDENERMVILSDGFRIVNSLANLDAKVLIQKCYQVIRIIKSVPNPF